jgi:hypothetical protein
MNPVHNIKCLLNLIGICIVAIQSLSSQDLYYTIPENGYSYNYSQLVFSYWRICPSHDFFPAIMSE